MVAEGVGTHPGARAAELSYPEVGATRGVVFGEPGVALPTGYHALRRTVRVGRGERTVVLGWGMQFSAGATVYPLDAVPEVGQTVLVTTRIGPVPVTAPCRVVWTVDEADRAGFGYGTLPGHPERGEEAFVVTRDATGDVWCTILAFSRLATWYARLGGPVGRLVQLWIARRYLRAFAGLDHGLLGPRAELCRGEGCSALGTSVDQGRYVGRRGQRAQRAEGRSARSGLLNRLSLPFPVAPRLSEASRLSSVVDRRHREQAECVGSGSD